MQTSLVGAGRTVLRLQNARLLSCCRKLTAASACKSWPAATSRSVVGVSSQSHLLFSTAMATQFARGATFSSSSSFGSVRCAASEVDSDRTGTDAAAAVPSDSEPPETIVANDASAESSPDVEQNLPESPTPAAPTSEQYEVTIWFGISASASSYTNYRVRPLGDVWLITSLLHPSYQWSLLTWSVKSPAVISVTHVCAL